jgi:S-methylmethionine-dependent homocysteine/selenocysteine methylase
MNWRQKLANDGVPVLDGGTGSELRRRGITLSPICWSAQASLDNIDVLTAIHRDYIQAGADIVTANTFAATRFVLQAAGLDARRIELVRNSVQAARVAAADAGREIAVAASVSCLPPACDSAAYPHWDAEYRAYAELAEQLAAAGADLLLLEMLQDPKHAEPACRAVDATGLPYWIGISVRLDQSANSGHRLVSFDEPTVHFGSILETVLKYSPAAMCIMHSPIDAMQPALEQLRAAWSGSTGAYAELPYAENPDTKEAVTLSPAAYAAAAREWLASGASILGGCCGTTPAHIAALRGLVEA